MHPVNLDSNIVRGIIIYIHSSIDNCVIQINPDVKFSKVCLLEIRLCGGDNLLFGCFYRSPNTTSTSEKNKANLNNLLKYLSRKKHSHQCCVGGFNFRNINWFTWSTLHDEESKEPQFIETIRDCYLYQCLLKPTRSRSTDNPSLIDLVLKKKKKKNIMLHSVRATIVLLPLNITAIWITPNRKKDMSIKKLVLIR